MYMAPAVNAQENVVPVHPQLRRAVGVAVLALAVLVALAWMAAQVLVGIAAIAARAGAQAADYAGMVALGR